MKVTSRLRAIARVGAAIAVLASAAPAFPGEEAGFTPPAVVLRPHPVSYRKRLASDVATIQLHANKTDASVILDGKLMGDVRSFRRCGTALRLSPGIHELKLEREGYRTLTTSVAVDGGRSYELHFQLDKAAM